MWRNRRTYLIRLGGPLMWLAFLGAVVGQGQSLAASPAPSVGLSVNGKPVPQTIQGEALIFSAVLFHPKIFGSNVTALVINPQDGGWGNTVRIVVTDSTGAAATWPIHPASAPPGALTLDGEQTGLLYWILSPADAQNIAPGTYQVLAMVDTTSSAGSTGWNGTTSSDVVSLQITAPAQPTAAQVQQQMTSQALAEHFLGNDTQALADVDQLLTQFPASIEALAFKGSLLAGLGRATEALQSYEQALAGFYGLETLDPEEPPSALLNRISGLRRIVYGGPGGGGGSSSTTIVPSAPGVTFSTTDQFVTLSATLSSSAGNVDGGTVTFAVTGLGSPVTSGPVTQGVATVGFRIPGGTHAGSYALTATFSGTDLFGSTADSSESLTISKATPALTWSNPADIHYGNALGAAQLDAATSVPGVFVYSPPTGTVLPAGSGQSLSVAFTPSDVVDYNSAAAAASINVIPAPLTVTANNASRLYGQANPQFGGSYSGFVNGESASVLSGMLLCNSTATAASPVTGSPYAINCSGQSSQNYAISYVAGVLTVVPAPLSITAINATKILDAALPSNFGGTYSGFVNGEGPSSLTGSLSCMSNATTVSPVGSYVITCSGQTSTNYSISYKSGVLRIIYQPGGMCDGDIGHAILQPINADGSSVLKQGRSVPAKFRVCDANAVSIGTAGVVASFYLTQISASAAPVSVRDAVSSTTPDTAFRWDFTDQQWIFNISTANLPAGQTYVYTITLNDGSTIVFQYGLR